MEELLNKLTEEQKTELGNLCQKINNIFEENDNFTEDEVDKYACTSFAGKSSIPSINAPSITTSSVTN